MQIEQVDHFKSHGYVVIDDFFTPVEVTAMRSEIERFETEKLIRNVTTDGDGQTPSSSKANLQLCPMSPHSDLFRVLPFEPKVLKAVTELIGSPFALHLDQVFLKPPKHGAGTGWHQDNGYFKIEDPLKGTAMWIAIHDGTIANGTLHVLPDAFADDLEHERDLNSDHHIRCEVDEAQAVACEIKAGSVAFFCYGTPHCTRANTTGSPRAGAAYHFLHVDHFRKREPKKGGFPNPVLTGPGASDGTAEHGEPIVGTWQRHVEALAN